MSSVAIETTAIREFLQQVLPGLGTDSVETAVNNIYQLLEGQLISPPGGIQPDTTLQNRLNTISNQLQTINTTLGQLTMIEAGSYVPTIIGGTTAGAGTYVAGSQIGQYRRIGDVCHFWATVEWTAHTGTGELRLSLPLVAGGAAGLVTPLVVAARNITYPAGAIDLAALVVQGTQYAVFRGTQSNAALLNTALDTAGQLYVSGSYLVQ